MGRRNAEQLERFYAENRQALFTYALSFTGSSEPAEDLVHAVFAKLLGRWRLPEDLRPYVFRMVRNAAFDRKRSQSRHQAAIQYFASPNGHPDPERYARYRELEAAMAHLNDDERECIVLKNLNGFTYKEISELRGVPLNTVASWHRRGLGKLRGLLGEE